MNALENFTRMMEGRQPERLPFHFYVTPPVADKMEAATGERNPERAFDLDFRVCNFHIASDLHAWRAAYAELGVEIPPNAHLGHSGTLFVKPESGTGEAYHFSQMLHPLENIESVAQLERLPFPDLASAAAAARKAELAEAIAQAHAAGKAVFFPAACSVFEHAWYLRGMDTLFGDLIEGNPVGDWLLDWSMNQTIARVLEAARHGADVIELGDDVGTQRGMMMAVPFWREHLKWRLKKIIDAVRAVPTDRPIWIFYHSDGDITPIVPELAEIGVQILNPVQPECMSLAQMLPTFQEQLAFWGMIGTQTTMPFGTADDVRAAVAELAGYARQGVRMIVAPSHVLEPEVPWENLTALVEAVKAVKL